MGLVDRCVERGLGYSAKSLERIVQAISFANWPTGAVRSLMAAVLKYAPDSERERLASAARGELRAPSKADAVAADVMSMANSPARLEGASQEIDGQRLVGGPLDMFDRELIGMVCSKSSDLGSGFELYDDVAALDRADRAVLWAALEPVVDITYGLDTPNGQRGDVATHPELVQLGAELRHVCKRLDCTAIADAFLLSEDEYYDIWLEGGAAVRREMRARERERRFSTALNQLSSNPKALAALEGLLTVLAESAPAGAQP